MSAEDENTLLKEFDKEFPTFKTLSHPCIQKQFNEAMMYKQKESSTVKEVFNRNRPKCNIYSFFTSLFPILGWLPKYNLKKCLVSDLLAGFTIAIIQIPQGMAYAALGGVNPIIGVYMAIFPILIYFIMGTSHHLSLGTFAVICLMASKPVNLYSSHNNAIFEEEITDSIYSPLEVAATVSLTVGLIQMVMAICKVGSISIFMTESFVSGFTTASAFLVITSQLKHVIGVEIEPDYGIFNIVFTYVRLIEELPKTNYVALSLSLSVIIILVIYTDIIGPKLKLKFHIPMEMFILIIGIVLSSSLSLNERCSVKVIGPLPKGLPKPVVPTVDLMTKIYLDCATIAIVSFSINISLATLFAIKEDYQINANQEMLALGCCNMFGSLFHCLPLGASISRTVVQHACGGKTQITSVFSISFLLITLLFSTKLLGPLPYSVLAGIVIKSLRPMLLPVFDLPRLWRTSFFDGIMWTTTFISVILINIELGLIIGLCLALLSIVFMSQNINVCQLGKVSKTNMYLELERYGSAAPIPGFIIIKITAGLHFANIHFAINKIEVLMKNALNRQNTIQPVTVVVDMSSVSCVDSQAMNVLKGFVERWREKQLYLCLSNCSSNVYEAMKRGDFIKVVSENAYFPTIHDAIVYTLKKNPQQLKAAQVTTVNVDQPSDEDLKSVQSNL